MEGVGLVVGEIIAYLAEHDLNLSVEKPRSKTFSCTL